MIPATAEGRTQFTNLPGERVEMGFDPHAVKHLMDLLTQYSDQELAVIREYSTNAHDSHVEAGERRPIEVTTPTSLAPFFRVRDWGVGLSVEDIHNLYSQYGASSKRSTNDATGMLGIGSKAALAYTAQFTLTSVKDGVKVMIAVSKDEDGGGSMTIVDTSNTDEPNGVEVTIPARAINDFKRKAEKFFSYWKKGTLLLDGKEPRSYLEDEHMKLTDHLILRKTGAYENNPVVVMGNIAYPAGELLRADTLDIPREYSVVAHVPIGTLEFVLTREALRDTKRTREALQQIGRTVKDELVNAVQREITQAPSAQAAVQAVLQWQKLLGNNRPKKFVWRGRDLPTRIAAPQDDQGRTTGRILITRADNYRLGKASNVGAVELNYLINSIFVTGYDMAKFTPTHKHKLRHWLGSQDPQLKAASNHFVIFDFPIDESWIDPKRVIDWATIKAIKLPQSGGVGSYPTSRLPGSYDIVRKQKGESDGKFVIGIVGSGIDMTVPTFYVRGNRYAGSRYAPMFEHLPAYNIFCLGANRIDKFKRDNPGVRKVADVLKEQYEAWKKKLTQDQKFAIQMTDDRNRLKIMTLKPVLSSLKDPALKEAYRIALIDVGTLTRQRDQFRLYLGINSRSDDYGWKDPMVKYPLIDCIPAPGSYGYSKQKVDHMVRYLNAAYKGGW